jgi:CRISPR-associated protein Csm4
MAFTAYRLRLDGPLHFGTGREHDLADVEDLPRSDTLASALLSVWPHVARRITQSELAKLAAAPPFALSSALPTLKVGARWEPLFFLPADLAERLRQRGESGDLKRLKKLRFADRQTMTQLIRGVLPANARPVGPALLCDAMAPSVLAGSENLWRRQVHTRVSIDRRSGRAADRQLFHFGATVLESGVRLTVLVDFLDPTARRTFEAALRLLGDDGIGGERGCGYGRFQVEAVEENVIVDFGKDARLALSLLHPSRKEVDGGILAPPAAYRLVPRGGWAMTGAGKWRRRPAVNMLAEGSVVRDLNQERYGDSVCVLPAVPGEHAVYRIGCALTVPIAPPGVGK